MVGDAAFELFLGPDCGGLVPGGGSGQDEASMLNRAFRAVEPLLPDGLPGFVPGCGQFFL